MITCNHFAPSDGGTQVENFLRGSILNFVLQF